MAVTSNRGSGKALLRPGANPQLEQQYYQNKLVNGKAGTELQFLETAKEKEYFYGTVTCDNVYAQYCDTIFR